MRTSGVVTALLIWLCAGVTTASAQDPIHKAGRGATNILAGWIELPKNFSLGMQEDNPVLGAVWGLAKGVGLGVTRMVLGAYEVVTFPIPYPQGYASPYEGLELGDYPWE
jgi:putative exosortase-associated protein (TIGR04073 family)